MGTRFLPATKANSKEMLPIVDKPLIQYAVEEAVEADITKMIFVTSSAKRAIEDHFDKNYEMESELKRKQKYDLFAQLQSIVPKGVFCVYIRQPETFGLGHAVLCLSQLMALVVVRCAK
ncbi:MAG TPA: sugar phosphate nucleotidyltransferase [Nitrosomonas europaea]|uniref:sugar phosphate nucleotidyltransferase n=1 Tax=Nitrosomonas europaea TaxID=915 RepID=UPI00248FE1CA|nr:sugar phosphate nucleotidyltransferase [Nitrosomonas europaea]HRN82194.1 sugar phosphate nucleotidyltransferase [Nitrosomonas europaea]HRO56944.1 sugar phosphate nucleotidyltransferase [Nitrosomonas europaea]HRQ08668.1 sugar phosphate nucleotidyltransferase [Nitrosomonas europaea]HUM74471.1 sugar phosphate nucleotidyltransferase [Nitrosomonas europaea]